MTTKKQVFKNANFYKTPEILQSNRRQDFAMILGVFKAVARAHTWAYVTADTAAESTKSAQKPTPKLKRSKSNDTSRTRASPLYRLPSKL
ncbi:hypothetical protein [Helicobacter canis]|uniref:Uncharacterized protein n=1 Tax=Helicobacter canis NCTC 12740 TaxID=1357399 RepID=V8CIV0_9HELI|nr:hypothetical protein [Helicobacter canis]ETD27343.1 hypothetical protein HMPREF2087_00255 [Helicobacter canis NCTC 12740]